MRSRKDMPKAAEQRRVVSIVSYHYSVEVSPFLKNICTYYRDKGWEVRVLADALDRDPMFSIPGVRVYAFNDQRRGMLHILRLLTRVRLQVAHVLAMSMFLRFMGVHRDAVVFVADFDSLHVTRLAGVNLSRCIYLALENTALMRRGFTRKYATSLLAQCRMRIIPDAKRADNINDYLGTTMSFQVMPVSQRPPLFAAEAELPKAPPLRLVYSGYFAQWSCLSQLLPAIVQCSRPAVTVMLQGHAMGTDEYQASLIAISSGRPNITLSREFFSDSEHHVFLQSFHVGIACYEVDEIGNFENMLFSSGKIATYLWAGLAILTNIDTPLTHAPPFVLIRNWTGEGVCTALEPLTRVGALATYREAAKALAAERYNFDDHMARLASDCEAAVHDGTS